MATSKELAELIIERPASTTRTKRLERLIEKQAGEIWMLTQDDDGDGITATDDLKERLEKNCWDYYHHRNERGRTANPGEGTEWSSIYGEAFAEAVASFDPMKANWDNPCKFLTHLETKFKNIRDRASRDEFAQERDRVSLDKLAGTPSKQADDDGLPEDKENLSDDEDVQQDGDDDGLRDDGEGGLASNDDGDLPDDGEDLSDIEDGLPDIEEDELASDDGELIGDDDAQTDYARYLQGDADPLQRLVGDTAHAEYLYSLYWDMALLVIEFTQHRADKAHNDVAKLFRCMCFTDKTTSLVKRQKEYNDCRFVERHWSDALEAMEQGFLDFYMVSSCATVESLWSAPIKECYRFAIEDGVSGSIGMLEAWAVINDAYRDYISDIVGYDKPSSPRVSQRKNEFMSLMFESMDICKAYIEQGFIVVKENGIRKAVRSEDYKVMTKNGVRRAYHRGVVDPNWAPKKRVDQSTDGRKQLWELHDRVGRKEFSLVATLLGQEAGDKRWGQKIVELLRGDGTSGTSRRDREAFSECLDAIVASGKQYTPALGGTLVGMARNSHKLGESGRWAALRCCKAVLDAYELGKMDVLNARQTLGLVSDIMGKGVPTAIGNHGAYQPVLASTPEEQSIIDAINSGRQLLAGRVLTGLGVDEALNAFFGNSKTWQSFR